MDRMEKRLLFGIAMLCFMAIALFNGEVVWARQCVCGGSGYTAVSASENDSIANACSRLSSSDRSQGIIWISDSSSNYSIDSTITTTRKTGTMTIYLHGAVINDPGYESHEDATHIKLVKGSSSFSGQCLGSDGKECSNYDAFIGEVPSSMKRPLNRPCANTDFESYTKSMTLDIGWIVEHETPTSETSRETVYKIPIQVFRCYGYSNTPGPNNTHCFSSKSILRIVIENPDINITLTSHAIDKDSGATLKSPCAASTATIKQGETKNVTVGGCQGQVSNDYVFVCWRDTPSGGCISDNEASFTKSIGASDDVYAVYETSEYEGQSKVPGGVNTVTKWVATSDTAAGAKFDIKKGVVENCPSTGCNVTFEHNLRRVKGGGNVEYKITKTTTYESINTTTLVESKKEIGTNAEKVGGDEITLYPGMMVCETLYFNTELFHRDDLGTWSFTTVCVSALGNPVGDDPTGDGMLIDINVKRGEYGDYAKEVYA
ncbi:hypothetical protein IKF30_00510, partial [Candidatus Saccharibacteria bacterium]|nr:hypothetical protein [Candidatus Saccharibacteria bacterium]